MTVGKLIEKLQALNPELMVVRDGYEGGVTEVGYAEPVKIALDVNEDWYYGEHEVVDEDENYTEYEHVQAVRIS